MILKILSFILLFTFGCLVQKTSYKPVMQITGIGDSTMAGVGVNNGEVIQTFSWNKYFDSFENEGVSGTPIEYWINNPDKRHLKTVIISIGFNNAKIESQSVTKIINLYKIMLSKIYAKRIYIIDDTSIITFFDPTNTLTCSNNSCLNTISVNQTLGWIMGFRLLNINVYPLGNKAIAILDLCL